MSVQETTFSLAEHWKQRRTFAGMSVGASDVPAILGLSPWTTPLQLYLRMRGELDWPDESERMEIGSLIEPVVATLYERRTGRTVTSPPELTVYHNSTTPWLHCTPDRFATDGTTNGRGAVELKNRAEMSLKEWRETGPPMSYQAQLQAQLATLELEWGSLAVLFGNATLVHWDFTRDVEIGAWIAAETQDFVNRVQLGDPPKALGADSAVLAKMFPQSAPGKVVRLDDSFAALMRKRDDAKLAIKAQTEVVNEIDAAFKMALGDAELGELPNGGKVSWKSYEQKAYEVKAGTRRPLRYTAPKGK